MEDYQVKTKEELADIIGEPIDFIKEKVAAALDDEMKEFVSKSTLIFVSTIDAQGNPDVSPKGDPAGFVLVNDDTHICLPDRPGNKLLYGFNNIINNPVIGLIFVVPNLRETLRIKGKASLSKDPELLNKMSVNGRPALLATNISIEECFFHCGKAMIRSKIWEPDSWEERGKSLMAKQVAKILKADDEFSSVIESEIEKNYEQELY
jgi:PPOX class probable FMN-dependent enzyme